MGVWAGGRGGPVVLSAQVGAGLHRSTLGLEYQAVDPGAGLINVGFASSSPGDIGGDEERATGWDLDGRCGLEGGWRVGALSLGAHLTGLLPLWSSQSHVLELSDGTFTRRRAPGAQLGVEVGIGAWFVLE